MRTDEKDESKSGEVESPEHGRNSGSVEDSKTGKARLAVVHIESNGLESALHKFLSENINLVLMEGEALADSGAVDTCCSKGCCR